VEYLRDFNLRALGCEYQMPVAYLLGAEDTQASTALAAEFFERIQAPRKLLRIIEGAGHNTAADAPAAFAVTLGEARVLIG
jgi:alpha-beta hydrolase superfamily lysophospholipase